MSNPTSLVVRVLKSKYFKNGDFLHSTLGPRPSYTWRSILYGRDLLSKGLVRDIGNGEQSNVWSVNWIIDPTPRTSNYRPNSVIDLTLKISGLLLLNSSSWDATRVRQAFTDHDADIILRLRLKGNQEDGYKWGFTKDGVYTSRSGYRFLDNLPNENGPPQPTLSPLEKKLWSLLWKIKAPPKIKHFLWKALSGTLAVTDRLQSRGLDVDTTCRVCNGGIETICHLFFTCPMAKDTWGRASIKLPNAGFSTNFVFLNIYHLLEQSKKFPKDLNIASFPWILWHLWKARNGLAFERIQYSSLFVITRAKEEANMWFEINFPRAEEPQPPLRAQETSVSWVKPPTGFRICNIGVSWISRHVNCGAAWILRDDKGRGILHSRRAFSNVESKREAELLAMQWAVRDMVSTRQPRIVFESSCDQERDTFMNLPSYVEHPSVVNEILLHLRSLHDGAFTTVFERRILLLRIFL